MAAHNTMKRLAAIFVCVLVVSVSLADISPLCPSPVHLPRAKLSILSFRNPAGEWTSQLNFTRGTPGDEGLWDIDLVQEKVLCEDGGELVTTLLTVTTLPADVFPPQQQGPTQTTIIKPGYKEVPGVCISKLHTTAKTWAEAKQICASEGTHLAIINSVEEATYYKNTIANHKKFSGSTSDNYIFLGFEFSIAQRQFLTILGSELDSSGYTGWATGEPNNIGDSSYSCGGMDRDGKLNDVNCASKLAFFCEQ